MIAYSPTKLDKLSHYSALLLLPYLHFLALKLARIKESIFFVNNCSMHYMGQLCGSIIWVKALHGSHRRVNNIAMRPFIAN